MSARPTVLVVFTLAIGLTVGVIAEHVWNLGDRVSGLETMEGSAGDDSDERKIVYWVAPMDPNYRRDSPGKSPMGMDLVPVYEGGEPEVAEERGVVRIAPEVVNNLGVRAATAERSMLSREVRTVGFVTYDEKRQSQVHTRAEGWIERLFVRAAGERVKKDEPLFAFYSPDLVNAQAEYLQALRSGQQRLIDAAWFRLKALGISGAQRDRLAETGTVDELVRVYAPQDGVVTRLNVAEGTYVVPGTNVMTLADLSQVWLIADVFEQQAAWMEVGLPAEVRLPYAPGQVWKGQVDYVYPDLDPKTRTLPVRLTLPNASESLKPDMYADVALFASPREAVHVPRETVIRSGNGDRVVLALGNGRFRPVEVVTGIESGGRTEILEGLEAGDTVVASAQFLIDSESSLAGGFRRLTPMDDQPEPEPPPVEAEGVVNTVMPEAGKLNLTHEPIPEIGWPTMTMDFAVTDAVDLDTVAAGATVRFTLSPASDGSYEITAIVPVTN